MADRVRPASLTLATFNVHMGVDGWGRPYDVVSGCAGLGADLLVMGAHGQISCPFVSRGAGTRYILRHMTVPVLLSN